MARHARFTKLGSKTVRVLRQPEILPRSYEKTSVSEGILNTHVILLFVSFFFFFFYIYLLNGYRELNSFEEPCLTQVSTVTPFAREVNPMGLGEWLHFCYDDIFCYILLLWWHILLYSLVMTTYFVIFLLWWHILLYSFVMMTYFVIFLLWCHIL